MKVNPRLTVVIFRHMLLTGSTGSIGRHLKKRLEPLYAVSTFERSSGCDITNQAQVNAAVADNDVVLHFAATAVGRKKMQELTSAKAMDLAGLRNIAEAAREKGSFLLYPSSTLVYGKSDEPYAALKRESEELILSLAQSGLRYTILRLSTVYGPGTARHSVIALFLKQALRGEPFTVFGPGTEQRNFIFIDDVVSAVMTILDNRATSEGHIFDVCHTESTTLNELAQLILEVTGSKSIITHTEDDPPDDQTVSPKSIGEQFGWRPRVSLRNGLLKMLETEYF